MKCQCGREAIYYREFEGRAYCEKCFVKFVERNVRKTIYKHNLIDPRDHVIVALSGGKDSMVLLYILNKIFKKSKVKISALMIDEGISGYREKAIEKARELAKSLGINLKIVSIKDEFGKSIDEIALSGQRENPCTFCGIFRRYLLNKKARELGGTKIATGHNLDDDAQSVIMNFFRGDFERFIRLGYVSGIARDPKFIPRIKPLRNLLEKEIKLYADLLKIPYIDERCPHARDEIMRRELKNFLDEFEREHPGTKYQIVRFHERIKSLLSVKQKEKFRYCKICGEPTTQEICKACELRSRLEKNSTNSSSDE